MAVKYKKGFPTAETFFFFKCLISESCSCTVSFVAIVYGLDIPESCFFKVHLSLEAKSGCLDCVAVRKSLSFVTFLASKYYSTLKRN